MKKLIPTAKFCLLILFSSILIFIITRLMPLSPQEMLLSAYNLEHTPENIAFLTEKWGLDQPLHLQYFAWLKALFKGDWGRSLISNLPIKDELLRRLPYSLSIGLGSLCLTAILAFFMGYLAALKKGVFELISRAFALFSQAIPVFISSLFLIYVLGVSLGWVRFFTGNHRVAVLISIILLSLTACGSLSRVVRAHFLELKDKSYMKRLYAAGLKESKLLLRHGTKAVLYGMSGAMMPLFAGVIGGSSVLEFIFGIPGISFFLIESIKNRDYTVIQAYLFLLMLWMSFVHLLFHFIQNRLDRSLAR